MGEKTHTAQLARGNCMKSVFTISEIKKTLMFPNSFDSENKLLWKGALFCQLLGNTSLWSSFKHLHVANHR